MTDRELENLLTQNRQRVAEARSKTAGALRETTAAPQSTPPIKVEIEAPELL